jgi:hypothetical protein
LELNSKTGDQEGWKEAVAECQSLLDNDNENSFPRRHVELFPEILPDMVN